MKRMPKIIIGGTVFALILAFVATSYSPTMAIRKQLFLHAPLLALTCTLEKSDNVDPMAGQQYTINDRGGIYFAYVSTNDFGMYYWTGGGAGP